MKLALVHLNTEMYKEDKNTPLAVAYLASYARKYGGFNNIVIIDKEDPIKAIRIEKPDVVGISSSSPTYPMAKLVAASAKEASVPAICGGNHISTLPQAFCNSPFDLAVLGEGEQTLLELIQLFEKRGSFEPKDLKNIKGIMYRDNGTVKKTENRPFIENLDTIPFPARDLLDMDYYLQPRREAFSDKLVRCLQMITTRGCPYNCVFCPTQKLWGKPRFHSAEYVVNEMKHIIDKYKIEGVRIWDDTFNMNLDRLQKIVELVKKEGINKKVEFYVYGRANLINSNMCKLLKEMNVKHISFGFESGSEKTLQYLKKGTVTVEDNRKAIRLCKEAGFSIMGFFIIGCPGETEKDLKETMELVSNKNVDYANVLQLTPYPGTDIWRQLEKEGLVSENTFLPLPEYYNPNLILTKEVSEEKFKEWYDKFQLMCQSKYYGKSLKFHPKYLKYLFSPKFVFKALIRWKQVLSYMKFNK